MIMIKIKQEYDVEIFTASYCGWCAKTKEVLKNGGMMFDEKPLDDGAFLQNYGFYKDYLTISQYEKLNEFNSEITNLYLSIKDNPDNTMLIDNFFHEIIGKNDEDFFSIIKNIEYSEENQVVNKLADYLSENKSLVIVYNDFFNFKNLILENQSEFFAHVDNGEISVTIPQIFINGEVFPHLYDSASSDLGTYGELNRCIEFYGDVNSCLYDFAYNREQFMENMFPVLPEIEEESISTISLDAIGIKA